MRRFKWIAILCALALGFFLKAQVGSVMDMVLGSSSGNPGSGNVRLWANSGTGTLACLDSSGANCFLGITVVSSGTAVLGTSAITSGACATAVTVSATGVATTDVIAFTPNADITSVTGYAPVTTGGLEVFPYPTANNVNFKVCNPTTSSITPGAVTLNYRVTR